MIKRGIFRTGIQKGIFRTSRKSQISAFIIIGIVILGTALLLSYYGTLSTKSLINPAKFSIKDANKIKQAVQSCVNEVSEATLLELGENGYIDNEDGPGNLGVFYYDGASLYPGIAEFEKSISNRIEGTLLDCLNSKQEEDNKIKSLFDDFHVELGQVKATTFFGAEQASILVKLPTRTSIGTTQVIYEDYSYSAPIHFQNIHSAASDIIKSYSQDPGFIPATLLLSLAEKEYNITVIPEPDFEIMIFYLIEPNSKIKSEPFAYRFGVYFPQSIIGLQDGQPETIQNSQSETSTTTGAAIESTIEFITNEESPEEESQW